MSENSEAEQLSVGLWKRSHFACG